MNLHRTRVVLSLILLASLACDALSREPAGLIEQSRSALRDKNYETAYRTLADLRTRFPDRSESAEAFPLAVFALHKLYKKNRWVAPESPWVRTEPRFVFDWLANFFGEGNPPQEQLDILFLGMSPRFFDAFEEYAATHPVLGRWTFVAAVDDWKVAKVTASRGEQVARDAKTSR